MREQPRAGSCIRGVVLSVVRRGYRSQQGVILLELRCGRWLPAERRWCTVIGRIIGLLTIPLFAFIIWSLIRQVRRPSPIRPGWTALGLIAAPFMLVINLIFLSQAAPGSFGIALLVFGIGFGDWLRPTWMSDSMDNFWLLTAVRYGLPALLFLAAAIIVLALRQVRANANDAEVNRHRMAWLAITIGIAVSGITVHLWNAVFAYFFFLIGSGAWMAYPAQRRSQRRLAALLALNTPPLRTRAVN